MVDHAEAPAPISLVRSGRLAVLVALVALCSLVFVGTASAHKKLHQHVRANGTVLQHSHPHAHATHHRSSRRGPVGRLARKSDRTAPKLRFAAPLAGQTLSGSLPHTSCRVSASDASGIKYVEFTIDGAVTNREVKAPYTCRNSPTELVTSKLSNGSHVVRARAVDRAGNTRVVAIRVTVSNGPASSSPATMPASKPASGSDSTTVPSDRTVEPDLRPTSSALFTGDYETGTFAQYMGPGGYEHQEGAPQPQIVTDRVRSGRHAARFTVPAGGKRSEVVPSTTPGLRQSWLYHEGDERWFGMSYFLDQSWPSTGSWNVIAQWKLDGTGGPILGLSAKNGRFQLDRGETWGHQMYWDVPVELGRWVDFVVHVKFSSDPSVGFVELWKNGQKQTLKDGSTRTYAKTWDSSRVLGYLKHGIYRDPAITQPGLLWADEVRVGASYGTVAPA